MPRTNQNIKLFQEQKTKNILENILFIYSKENSDISYRQGMNELLSILYICFYPYYFNNDKKINKETLSSYLNENPQNHIDEIFLFFFDENEIQSDLFYAFNSLMSKGMKNLFDPKNLQKNYMNYL